MFLLFLVFVLCFQISACGFSPLYGTASQSMNAAAEAELNRIAIAIIPDRDGQYLRNALIDRFYQNGMPAAPIYQLNVAPINESVSDFDITVESEATRRQLKLTGSMSLIDKKTGQIVLTRPLLAITSHNVLESEFSTLVTEQSAREAALNDLARQIERQLALYFTQ